MKPSILIFDSGVGGLSILSQIRQKLPYASLHYLMDNAAFPYGTKADEILIQRVVNVCLSAVAELQPDLLVIACNTASTLTLPYLRTQLNIPVVGVVPAIKTAAESAQGGRIGLLATPATINRSYTDELIQNFASHCHVSRFGSGELVNWAETYLNDGEYPASLFDHLNQWLTEPQIMSHVVLGCTHFPLLRKEFERLWPTVQWIDSGEAIARRVAFLLPEPETPHQATPQLTCYWTDRQTMPRGALGFIEKLGMIDAQGHLGPDFLIQATSPV